jgi:alkaline phosphatase D
LQAEAFRKQYRRQRGVRNLLDFQASVAQLAIWDDHDFGMNDGDRTFPGKETSLKVFREYWANPQYGLPGQPGVFFRWSIGDVDFFFLDTRTYRDPDSSPNGPKKTQLGAAQKRWLKSELKKSRGTFKVLAASGGWTESRGRFGDNWGGFLHERNEIFNFIRDEGITGVFLLSGDSHRSQLNYIPWSEQGGYDLYEAMSSPLAQGVYDGWFLSGYFRHIRPDNVDSVSFGLLEFDTAARPARVTIRFFGPGGKSLWEPLILTADDLRPGVKSWDKK